MSLFATKEKAFMSRRIALIVGIDKYEFQIKIDLKAPTTDAQRVYDVLSTYGGFDMLYPLPLGTKKVGSSGEVKGDTLWNELHKIMNPQESAEVDLVVFYFSGHGVSHRGDSYLCATDEKLAVPLSSLIELAERSTVKNICIWLDCCYGGKIRDLKRSEEKGFCVVSASTKDEVARARDGKSLMTDILCKALTPNQYKPEISVSDFEKTIKAESKNLPQQILISTGETPFTLTQLKKEERTAAELEKNYKSAQALAAHAQSLLTKIEGLRKDKQTNWQHHIHDLRCVILYALEAQRNPIPDGKTAIAPHILEGLAQINAHWLLPKHEQIPALNLGVRVTAVACSHDPDGQYIASISAGTIHLWNRQTGQLHHILQGHSAWLTVVSFSRDGKQIASASGQGAGSGEVYLSDKNYSVWLWDTKTGKLLHTLKGHAGDVTALAFSRNGKQLFSASTDTTVRQWDTTTGQALDILCGHCAEVTCAAFSLDGKQLASASLKQGYHDFSDAGYPYIPDKTLIQIWDMRTQHPPTAIREFTGHVGEVTCLAFSSDGKQLASASTDTTVRCWDIETGNHLKILQAHASRVNAIAFSPDQTKIASASGDAKLLNFFSTEKPDNTIRIWDAKTGQPLNTLIGHTSAVNSLAFSHDSINLVSASGTIAPLRSKSNSDNTISLWNVKTGQTCYPLPDHASALTNDDTGQQWNTQIGRPFNTLHGHTKAVTCVAFSPDNQQLATASDDTTIKLWDAQTGETLHTLQGHLDPVRFISFSPNSKKIASASVKTFSHRDPLGLELIEEDTAVRLWDTQTGELLNSLHGHTATLTCLAFSPDGKQLASASEDKTVRLWNTQTGEALKVLIGHSNRVNAIAFSPDSQKLASASDDTTVQLWSTKTGQLLRTLQGHANLVTGVIFSPNGKQLASASEDKTVQLWDAKTGELLSYSRDYPNTPILPTTRPLTTGSPRSSTVISMMFSPDSTKLAISSSSHNLIELWDAQTGQVIQTLKAQITDIHTKKPQATMLDAIAFSPDNQYLAARARNGSSNDSMILVWDVHTGQHFKHFSSGAWSVAFSPDGRQIASGSRDGTVKLRLLNPANPEPILSLLHTFKPSEVADALKFLWHLELNDDNKFSHHDLKPAIFPKHGYYITWDEHTEKFHSLLDAPDPKETKMDQLIRWLEERKAFHA